MIQSNGYSNDSNKTEAKHFNFFKIILKKAQKKTDNSKE